MADPDPYVVTYEFAIFQASNPSVPLPAVSLDIQLENIAASTVELANAIKDVRRSDGALQNGIVTIDSLDEALADGISEGIGAADAIEAAAAAAASAASAAASAAAAAASAADAEAIAGANAIEVVFTPTGNLSSTNVGAALAELDAEKASVSHLHPATDITTAAISGLAGTSNVQAILEALYALTPKTGEVVLTMDDIAPVGWLMIDDTSIGDATSGATHAHATLYQALYYLLWNKVDNAYAPVSTGRGASAAADYAAHKTLTLTKMLGRVLGIAGAGSGLTLRTNGQTIGSEAHALTGAQTGPHYHDVHLHDPTHRHGTLGANYYTAGAGGANVTDFVAGNTSFAATGVQVRSAASIGGVAQGTQNRTADAGTGDAHPNMQPTSFLYARIKL